MKTFEVNDKVLFKHHLGVFQISDVRKRSHSRGYTYDVVPVSVYGYPIGVDPKQYVLPNRLFKFTLFNRIRRWLRWI